MCNAASFVLTKDDVFWSVCSDAHEDIIDEHGLYADGARGPNILRVEITPEKFGDGREAGEYTKPLKDWTYHVDQDTLPDWADPERDEARARLALKDWAEEKIIREGTREVAAGTVYVTARSRVVLRGQGKAALYDEACAEVYDNASIWCHGRSKATLYGQEGAEAPLYQYQSNAMIYDYARVDAYGLSRLGVYDHGVADVHDKSMVKLYDHAKAVLHGNSLALLDGDAEVKLYDNSKASLYGNSKATANGTVEVKLYGDSKASLYGHAKAKAFEHATVKICEKNASAETHDQATMTKGRDNV